LYEFALGLLVMACLYVTDRVMGKEKRPRGLLISVFFAVYFTGRYFVEYVKEFQTPYEETLTTGQVLSVLPAIVGYVGIYLSLKKRIPAKWNTWPTPGTTPPSTPDAKETDDVDDSEVDDIDEALAAGKRN
jgi:prolipoprotein diacylglyceryltransferase